MASTEKCHNQELLDAERQLSNKADNYGSVDSGVLTAESLAAPFCLNPDQLNLLVDPKNPWTLKAIGGPEKSSHILNTDLDRGLSGSELNEDELEGRSKKYGENVLPEKKATGLFKIMLMTLDDKVSIILIIAAVISLALGLYERFGEPTQYFSDGSKVPQVDWVEGVAILVAVIIVTVVGSVNDWQKERQFAKLNRKKEQRMIEVTRNGGQCQVSIEKVTVGDIIMVQPGDILPVDGIVLKSNDIECDESSVTGETDTMRKFDAQESMKLLDNNVPARKADCIMISGSKVLQGTGSYLVTAVGENSMWGRTMLSSREGTEVTPLQEKSNRIADGIAKFGVWSALISFIVLFIRFCVEISGNNRFAHLDSSEKGNKFMDIFIVSVTIVVVAVPEGLPLAVTLASAFATTRMVKDNCLVRVLKSCETMGGATSVCSDKTGTLTQNKMTVVRSLLRLQPWEIDSSGAAADENTDYANNKKDSKKNSKNKKADHNEDDLAIKEINLSSQGQQAQHLKLDDDSNKFVSLMRDSLCSNTSAYEDNTDPKELNGSKTEIALINYARTQFGIPIGELQDYRKKRNVVFVSPFDSSRKYMATVVRSGPSQYRILVKGAAEIIMKLSSHLLIADKPESGNLSLSPMTIRYQEELTQSINQYADSALRCIAAAYKDFTVSQDTDWSTMKSDHLDINQLTTIGIFAIQDPLRPGVSEAVKQCQRAGVVVRMVTGDNLRTARAISINANIISAEPDDDTVIIEGPAFRELSDTEATKICQKIRILARSSPQDKRRLVELLKSQGETVAVTGDGTNDAPALRLADVGFSMGIAGTEVAKEASDIIIMDDNFSSIVNASKWGRTVNDAVKKFLQFQLTVNVTAVTLTFISAVASSDNQSVLTAVQLSWVNLIMDTLAALALATDAPTDAVLDRLPDRRNKSLITPTMWKMIFGQAVFQLCVTFVLHFAGRQIFGYPRDLSPNDETKLSALVFNAFLWMQFFNMFVNRRLDNKNNLLVGITKNPFFPLIILIIGGFQIIIMFFGGAAFHVKPQTPAMWATAIICGFCAIPIGMLTRLIPDRWVIALYPRTLWHWFIFALDSVEAGFLWSMTPLTWTCSRIFSLVKHMFGFKSEKEETALLDDVDSHRHVIDKHLTSDERTEHYKPTDYKWAPGIEKSLADISFLQKVRGGRSRQSNRFFHKKTQPPPSTKPSRASMQSFGSDASTLVAFMAPMVVGGAIGGWAPTPKEPLLRQHSSSR